MPFSDIFPGFCLGLDSSLDDSMQDAARQRQTSEADDTHDTYFVTGRRNRAEHVRLNVVANGADARRSAIKSALARWLRVLRNHKGR